MKSDMIKKLEEHLESPEGKKQMEEYFKKIIQEQEIEDSQIDRFWNKYQDSLDEIVEKVKSKYESDKYRDMWYSRSIEPPEALYSFLYSVARKYGRELMPDEYRKKKSLMFTVAIFVLGNWEFELIQGQGSAIIVNKHNLGNPV